MAFAWIVQIGLFENKWHTEVLTAAHHIRIAAGDSTIDRIHIADAIEQLAQAKTQSLSTDREPKNPY